jgi:outer membrane protein TolC
MMKIFSISKLFVLFMVCMFLTSGITAYALDEPNSVVLGQEKNSPLVGRINFEDVLAKAKDHSYDLKLADYDVLISKQEVRGARSEYFPKFNFNAGMEYTRNFRDIRESTVMSVGDAFINPYTRFQSILGITVAYNLFDFGVRGGNLKAAKEEVKVKELETKEKLQEMNLTLLDTYTKILVTTKQIELNREILDLQKKDLAIKERLYNAKEISKTEYNDAKVAVNNTEGKIADLKTIKAESVNWLSFYTGEEYDLENLKVAELKKSDFDVLAFQDYTKSIIWKVHERNIKKKELELKVAKRNNYPELNAYGRYYLYGADRSNYADSLSIEPSNFTVGASLNMPLFDGFRNSALIEKTALELKQLHVERDKAIAQLMTRLATMRANLMYLDEQIEANEKAYNELSDKEKSLHRLVSKKLASPVEENETRIELLNSQIEMEKNTITHTALTRGIQILTEEY